MVFIGHQARLWPSRHGLVLEHPQSSAVNSRPVSGKACVLFGWLGVAVGYTGDS